MSDICLKTTYLQHKKTKTKYFEGGRLLGANLKSQKIGGGGLIRTNTVYPLIFIPMGKIPFNKKKIRRFSCPNLICSSAVSRITLQFPR